MGQRRRKTLVFLAILLHRTARDQILQLLISTEPEHFFATAGRVPRPQIFVHNIEKFFELERGSPGEHCNQLLRHEIGNPAGECIFL